MNRIKQLTSDFRAGVQQGIEVAHFIENGQADTPFADLFQRLEQQSRDRPLGITLLGLTEFSRSAALKWLYGHHFAIFSLEVSKQIGLLEVYLREQGYFLEKSTGERLEFSEWESFHRAVTEADLFRGENPELRLGTQAPTGARNLQVLMPESSHFVAESPALLTRLLSESNVLMVAAPPEYQLSETDSRVLAQLLEDMSAFWPLLPVDELAGDVDIPEHGWWDKHHSLITLPPTLLTTHIDAAIPPQLAEVDDELRSALQLSLAAKKHVSASEALAERYEQELRRLQSRKKRESRKSANQVSPFAQGDQVFWSQLRNEVNDDLAQLGKQLQETNRKRELPNSTGNASLKHHVEGLSATDLNREQSYKTIKLTLGDDYRKSLMQFIQATSKEALKQDVAAVQQQVHKLGEGLSNKCQKQLGYKPNLPISAIDESGLWRDIKEMIALELRYQGEIPKRGFVDRLSEGRKGAMMLLMAAMLLGYIGIDLRNSGWMGFILLPFFVGAISYTYISFKRDEKHRLDKEITRVRDELLNNSRRLVADILRLKQSKLTDYLDQLKKQWQQSLEQLSRDNQARQQREREETSTRARARISAIDSQLSEWQRYQMPVRKLVSDAEALQVRTRQQLQALGR